MRFTGKKLVFKPKFFLGYCYLTSEVFALWKEANRFYSQMWE